ncbi:hypothetical protein N7509_008263, partial [Penicillium cosmopolitanum]
RKSQANGRFQPPLYQKPSKVIITPFAFLFKRNSLYFLDAVQSARFPSLVLSGKDKSMIKARKPHNKSRNGCIECKRRHVKCDETRPKCVNCEVSKRHCSYEDMISSATALVSNSRRKPKRIAKNNKAYVDSSHAADPGVINDSPPVNKLHLELLHHFITDILRFLGLNNFTSEGSTIDMTRYILAAPFLMNQILAFAALHLSIIKPTRRDFYQYHASQLQTHALSEFNSAKLEISAETCVPMFLFSSCLGMHVLTEKLLSRPDSFQTFLDDFIQSLRMHSGVRAVAGQSWHLLLQSPLKSWLEHEGSMLDQSASGDECLELLALVDTMLDPTISSIYRLAIEDLQKAYNASCSPSSNFSRIGPIISWPVTISSDYIKLLTERRPGALAILSHFGALLHMHSEMWTFGDSGLYIIASINDYLGPEWERWLQWPNAFIRDEM